MAYISADQHTISIEIETDDVLNEISDDAIVQIVSNRGLEYEMLEYIDHTTIVDFVLENGLDSKVLDNMELDEAFGLLARRGAFDLSKIDDDDLLNEVRQRNLIVVPDDVVNAIDTLSKLLPKDAGKRFI